MYGGTALSQGHVGIDPDRAQIGLARERAWLAGVEIDFMVGDLFDTPSLLPAESFGLAVDRGAFYMIEGDRERQRYLANIHRLLFRQPGNSLFDDRGDVRDGLYGAAKKVSSPFLGNQL